MTLKNIATVTENKKLDANQVKYAILEDMKFHNFRFDTSPGIRNVFHVDRFRAASMNSLPFQISDDSHTGPSIINVEKRTQENDVERILKKRKRGRGYQYLAKWKDYARFTWEPVSAMEDTVALDEFELWEANWKIKGMFCFLVVLSVSIEKSGPYTVFRSDFLGLFSFTVYRYCYNYGRN